MSAGGSSLPVNDGVYKPTMHYGRKKGDACFKIGSVFAEKPTPDVVSAAYVIKPVSPFICPVTLRLAHENPPHVVLERLLEGRFEVPLWTHSQREEDCREAARRGRRHWAKYPDYIYRWTPAIRFASMEDTDDDYWCAVYRMEWFETFRTQIEGSVSIDVIRELISLQDMNQMRLIFMDSHRLYNREAAISEVGEDAYTVHYGTTLASVMHYGLLPDIAAVHMKLPFWSKPTETFSRLGIPFTGDVIASAMIRIFTKVLLQPSKMRELNKCIFDEIERMEAKWKSAAALDPDFKEPSYAPRFMMMLVRMIFVSLAGMYPHSRYIPGAVARRELYRQYMYSVPTLKEFKAWIMRSKRLMTMVLRENHLFNLESMPGLAKVFKDLYEYDKIFDITMTAMAETSKIMDVSIQNVIKVVTPQFIEHTDKTEGAKYASAFYGLHMPLTLGTLSNIGDMLWTFAMHYASSASLTYSRDIFAHFFWRCTNVHIIENWLTEFHITGDRGVVEAALRTIVIYWLIVRDMCADQSKKKYCKKYETCVGSLDKPDMRLLPSFPPGKRDVGVTKTGKPRKPHSNRHNMLLYLSKDAEKTVLSSMRCRRHEGVISTVKPDLPCDCIVSGLIDAVEYFDIYRTLSPDTWADSSTVVGKGIEQYLWAMYNSCLAYCYRPRQTTFTEEIVSSMVSVCNVFDTKKGLGAEVGKKNGRVDEMFDAFHAEHAKFKETRDEKREIMEAVVQVYGKDKEVSFEWLTVTFGVDINAVHSLGKARTMMLDESNHRSPYNTVLNIAKWYPRDFWIIRLFFKINHRYESIKLHNLSADIAKQQIASLHTHYNYVLPGEKLPEGAGCIYFCPYHKKILSPVVGVDTGTHGYINTHAVGVEKIIVDPMTGEKYCNVKTGRIKRRCVHADEPDDKEDALELIRRLPRKVRKCFEPEAENIRKPTDIDIDIDIDMDDVCRGDTDSNMGDEDTVPDLLGSPCDSHASNAMEDEQDDPDTESTEDEPDSDDPEYMSDTDMGSDEETNDDSMLSPGGALGKKSSKGKGKMVDSATLMPVAQNRKRRSKKRHYGRCTREPAKKINLIGKIFSLYKTLWMLCPYCGHVMRHGRDKFTEIGIWCGTCVGGEKALAKALNIVWDSTNNCADPMHMPPVIHNIPVWKEAVPSCMFCNKYPSGTRHLQYALVYNDIFSHRPFGLCYVPFCPGCAKWWIGETVSTIRLSNIFHNLTMVSDTISNNGRVYSVLPKSINMDGERCIIFSLLYGDILEDQCQLKLQKIQKLKRRRPAKRKKRKKAKPAQSKEDLEAERAIEAAILEFANGE